MIQEEIMEKLRQISPEEQAILDGHTRIQRDLYMDPGSSEVDAGRLLAAGKLMDVRPHTRFVHFPEHCHNYVEMVYMCCGTTTHIANGTPITLEPGELLIFGQGARQEILPAGEGDVAVNFIILPQFFDKALEMMGQEETPLRKFIVDCLGNNSSGFLYYRVADVLPIRNTMENMLWTLFRELPNRRSILQANMGLLFMHLLDHTDRLVHRDPEEEAAVRVLRYIEENYRTASLGEIAELLHYDFCWLSRDVHRRTGRNFKELLQEKRLVQAGYLLSTTALRVEEVADAVGYSNLSYFHRIFRERYGMTPRHYREVCRARKV